MQKLINQTVKTKNFCSLKDTVKKNKNANHTLGGTTGKTHTWLKSCVQDMQSNLATQ